jgi:hypothetical protein
MRKTVLLVIVTIAAAVTSGAVAARGEPSGSEAAAAQAPKQQPLELAFFGDRTVPYWNFGPIKLRPGNKLGTIWLFANGPRGQLAIIDAIPGRKEYSALLLVSRVSWASGLKPRILRSAAALERARAAGELRIARTSTVLNAPVVGFGQKAHPGFARGELIHYYELGTVKIARGNEVLPIWTFTNGVPGQRNIAEVVPGATDYPPLWQVVETTWKDGANRRVLRSFAELKEAIAAGDVSLKETRIVVNCPLV